MNVQIALRNSHDTTDTRSSRTIPRPWVVIAGVVAAMTIALAGGAILQDNATTEQVAAFSPGLTDSVTASAKVPQAGMPDGVWLDAESGAASVTSITNGAVLSAGLPDGYWHAETTGPADYSCGTRGPC